MYRSIVLLNEEKNLKSERESKREKIHDMDTLIVH